MPRVKRSRVIVAPRAEVWRLISDPHHLARWWPRVARVEDVRDPGGRRARWTSVLQTERGTGVKADYRCLGRTEPERYAWAQELEDTPFEKILTRSELEIRLDEAAAGTEVRLESEERLRGLSRFGSPMLRVATRRRLDEALDGIERALVGEDE